LKIAQYRFAGAWAWNIFLRYLLRALLVTRWNVLCGTSKRRGEAKALQRWSDLSRSDLFPQHLRSRLARRKKWR
jgi:hypothetical protein